MEQNSRICNNCNGTIPADVDICPFCGSDLTSASSTEELNATGNSAVSVEILPPSNVSVETSSELSEPAKSRDVIIDAAPVDEKLPDAFAGLSDSVKNSDEKTAATNAPAVDVEQLPSFSSVSDSEKKNSIPAYIPTPKTAKTEVDDLREVPKESKTTESPIKNNRIWLWILIAAAVLIILCICGIAGLSILGSA